MANQIIKRKVVSLDLTKSGEKGYRSVFYSKQSDRVWNVLHTGRLCSMTVAIQEMGLADSTNEYHAKGWRSCRKIEQLPKYITITL
jgi:hypothetical protein